LRSANSVPRKEGRKKVTGQALYVDDISFSGNDLWRNGAAVIPRGRIKILLSKAIFPGTSSRSSPRRIFRRELVALILNDQPYLAEK